MKMFMLVNTKTYYTYRIYPLTGSHYIGVGIYSNESIKGTLSFVKSKGVSIIVKGDNDFKKQYTPNDLNG